MYNFEYLDEEKWDFIQEVVFAQEKRFDNRWSEIIRVYRLPDQEYLIWKLKESGNG